MGEITKNPMIDLNGVSARLKELEEQTGCPIKQINGQRIFGPPHDWGDEKPPRGSEIFVGRLPRDMFEDNLYPIFSTYGRLYTMRLMLEFSGVNRGFAFVTYSNPEEAKVAVEKLNRFEIIPNHTILAFISIDNCRLFVANIPCTKTIKDILVLFRRIMRGLVSVILCPNSKKGRNNRGFAFLEFDCHKNALEARKRFWPYNLKLWNRKLFVDWAIPHHLKSQCKQLLLKGLNTKTTSEALANAIYARLNKVTLLGLKIRGAEAVITFKTRSNATEAYQKLRGLSIGGAPLSVLYKFPEEEPINNGPSHGHPITG
ncbi:APOBEC1 complementation factor-like isoform X2 [Agrilus planipennis]|uniref:APOBEC1 complementation factor-like isoform X2 n=1 Tax=Agrilus planipennis TaxID=224129 RepID=A0A1W4XHF9_AGRPL|nr:APOBEC1 complementation factor-like isoform X2 [Agrilus planipennis]